jgi:predicted transcriptional regulator of viral defense system
VTCLVGENQLKILSTQSKELLCPESDLFSLWTFSPRHVTNCMEMLIIPDDLEHMTQTEQILTLMHTIGVLRPRDLDAKGIPRTHLRRMLASGLLASPSRGLYTLSDAEPTEQQSLIEVAKRVPHGVICLLSALQFHELTTQAPFEIWLAIGESARRPKVDYPPLRIVRFSQNSLNSGVVEHILEGIPVKVTTPAKTVADCFKYRNKIGLDVALESLRDCWKKKLATIDEIHQMAVVCRVSRVIRPYLESLT